MKTERRRHAEPPKRRLIVVPETEPYVSDEAPPVQPPEAVSDAVRERPTVRERAVRIGERPRDGAAPESAGRYSLVYGRSSPSKPGRR